MKAEKKVREELEHMDDSQSKEDISVGDLAEILLLQLECDVWGSLIPPDLKDLLVS